MCGISGFYHLRENRDYTATITDMLQRISHRGPDELGFYVNKNSAIGTVRLSIVDIQQGRQPMHDPTSRYWISYSGEIYNHAELRIALEKMGYRFKTESDTEVALYAWIHWSESALTLFNGSFAFAIYDVLEDRLILARDRYGKRPLYYYHDHGELIFSSEMKSFLALPNFEFNFDIKQLVTALSTWATLPNETVFKNVHQLPMGAYLVIDRDKLKINEYYQLHFSSVTYQSGLDDMAAELRHLMSDSVRMRLMGDVEVGAYLSGGLDSAIVTKLACEHSNKKVRTFSLAFDDKEYDEQDKQLLLRDHLDTMHDIVRVTRRDIVNYFPEAVWHAEAPLFRTASVPMYLLSKMVNQAGIKVVVTGEGADESFLGYDVFKETMLRVALQTNTLDEQSMTLAEKLHPHMGRHKCDANMLLGIYNRYEGDIQHSLYSHFIRFNQSKLMLQLLDYSDDELMPLRQYVAQSIDFATYTPVQKAQWLEFKTLLGGHLLSSQGDRMSFANSVENRCPFLDYRVVEYAMKVPVQWRIKDKVNEKYILKHAFKRDLPGQILDQPKQPYQAPDALCFWNEGKPDYLDAILSDNEIAKLNFINQDKYGKFIQKMRNISPERISPRESQTIIQLLSLALLSRYFVQRIQSR